MHDKAVLNSKLMRGGSMGIRCSRPFWAIYQFMSKTRIHESKVK